MMCFVEVGEIDLKLSCKQIVKEARTTRIG
jgi:hypothetical protein